MRLTRGSPIAGHAHPTRVDEDPAVDVLIADECVSPIQCDHSSRPLVMAAAVCDDRLAAVTSGVWRPRPDLNFSLYTCPAA